MDNSFSSKFKVSTEQDGAIAYSYGSQGQRTLRLLTILALPLYFVSCSGTGYAIHTLSDTADSFSWGMGLGFVITVAFMFFATRRRETLRIYPGQGIVFRRKSVPFGDMSDIVIYEDGDLKRLAVDTMGRRIPITNGVPDAMARALRSEIVGYYRDWEGQKQSA